MTWRWCFLLLLLLLLSGWFYASRFYPLPGARLKRERKERTSCSGRQNFWDCVFVRVLTFPKPKSLFGTITKCEKKKHNCCRENFSPVNSRCTVVGGKCLPFGERSGNDFSHSPINLWRISNQGYEIGIPLEQKKTHTHLQTFV